MSNTATRLLSLIMLMQRQPNQKASELAEALGVSVRTLHRYMAMLDELGIPVYSERGPQGGFSLVRGYKMPPLVFSPAEAVVLCLGAGLVTNLWAKLYDEAACSALAKLESLLPAQQLAEVAWARRTLVASPMQRSRLEPLAALLDDLRGAIRGLKRVRMVYQGGTQTEPLERDLDAYALGYQQGWCYVIGYCHLRQAVRSFRVDRIQRLEVLEASYQIPPGFDAQAHLDFEFQGESPVKMRLRFEPQFTYLILNTPTVWESEEAQADGSVIVTATMPDLYWAGAFVLSYGPALTVVEPKALCHLVRAWALEVASRYSR